MVIRLELIDELLKDTNSQELLCEDGLLKQLTKALVERCLETELDTHLEQTKQGHISSNSKHYQKVDDADSKLEACSQPIRHRV